MGKSKGSTDKRHAQRSLEATERNKQLFVEALAKGAAPGDAAQKVKIARSTAYAWRREDPAFAEKWDNAVQTALDKLETALYDRAMKGNSEDARWILRYRRPEVYGGKHSEKPAQSNFIRNITLEEHYKRLERLGLPLPVIESDYEEVADDAGEDRDRS